MRVILQKDVKNLGLVGEIVRVKDGYARNFLVPRGLAVVADERNVRRLEHQKRMAAAKAAKELAKAQALAEQIEQNSVSIARASGEDGKLFGAVTNRDIAEALAADGFTVDRRQIEIEDHIRSLGMYQIPVRLERGVTATLKVFVINEDG